MKPNYVWIVEVREPNTHGWVNHDERNRVGTIVSSFLTQKRANEDKAFRKQFRRDLKFRVRKYVAEEP